MTNLLRTDIHRPSAITPEDYAFVSFDYLGSSDLGAIMSVSAERTRFQEHMKMTGGKYSQHEHGGVCHVCGCVNVTYTCKFYHAKTNTYIVTGSDCAEKMDLSIGNMNLFRTGVRNGIEFMTGKKKAQATLEESGLLRCYEIYDASDRSDFRYEESTITDIVSKLVKYGSISEKATNFLKVLLEKLDTRAEREAEQKAKADAAAPVPTGKVTITGTVLTVKVQDGFYGPCTKMLVVDDSGFKVWGTRPSGSNVERGARLSFTATVEPSPDDTKFGFFKRPSKVVIL
jgi:hypothetical protein